MIFAAQREALALGERLVRGLAAPLRGHHLEAKPFKVSLGTKMPGIRNAGGDEGLDADPQLDTISPSPHPRQVLRPVLARSSLGNDMVPYARRTRVLRCFEPSSWRSTWSKLLAPD